jgi:hypothetical protein
LVPVTTGRVLPVKFLAVLFQPAQAVFFLSARKLERRRARVFPGVPLWLPARARERWEQVAGTGRMVLQERAMNWEKGWAVNRVFDFFSALGRMVLAS